jgi:hypothetical protein
VRVATSTAVFNREAAIAKTLSIGTHWSNLHVLL